MLRLRVFAALAGALLAGLSVATIAAARAHDDEGPRARDYAFGVGDFGPGCTVDRVPPHPPFCLAFDFTVRVLAVSRGHRHRAWGLFERRNNVTGFVFAGSVTCMNIDGNRASIAGFLEPQPGSDPYYIHVEDKGPPGSGVVDRLSPLHVLPPGDPEFEAMPLGFPRVCPEPTSLAGWFPLTSGDITVSESVSGTGDEDD